MGVVFEMIHLFHPITSKLFEAQGKGSQIRYDTPKTQQQTTQTSINNSLVILIIAPIEPS
jgi:hypothetical protein